MKNTDDILIKVQNYGKLSDEPEAEILNCYAASLSYCITDTLWDMIEENMVLYLDREYDNPHDHNAISINLLNDDEYYTIGYIPMKKNEKLASIIDMGWGDILGCRVSEKCEITGSSKSIKLSVFIKNISCFKKAFITETYRAAYIDEEYLQHINNSLLYDGYVYFRWGGFPPQEHNLPNVKEKVFFIYKNEDKAQIYMMNVMARGDNCTLFFNDPEELDMIDDCTPFILTNIKGPVNVDIEKLDFIENEDICNRQPESIISNYIARKLKLIINIMQ